MSANPSVPGWGVPAKSLDQEIAAGARLVSYQYVLCFIFFSLKRRSAPKLIRPGQGRFLPGLPYTLLTIVAGIWGIFGFIFSLQAIATNLKGGEDITGLVLAKRAVTAYSAPTSPAPNTAAWGAPSMAPAPNTAAWGAPSFGSSPASLAAPSFVPASVPPTMSLVTVAWRGKSMMIGMDVPVLLDGSLVGVGSFVKGFLLTCVAPEGAHRVDLKFKYKSASHAFMARAGGSYRIEIEHSRVTGSFSMKGWEASGAAGLPSASQYAPGWPASPAPAPAGWPNAGAWPGAAPAGAVNASPIATPLAPPAAGEPLVSEGDPEGA